MFFTAKLASLLLAIAVSAHASVVARNELAELSVIFFNDVGFTGAAYASPGVVPGVCNTLSSDWLDRAESVIVGTGYVCTFFIVTGCECTGTQLSGSVSSLPNPPLYNNIESFFCTEKI